MKRSLVAILTATALTLASAPSAAEPPGDVQTGRLLETIGLNAAVDRVFAMYFTQHPKYSRYTQQQKACVEGLLKPEMLAAMRRSMAASIGEAAYVEEFMRFSTTSAGRKFVSYQRRDQASRAPGDAQPDPGLPKFFKTLSSSEQKELEAYLSSPAADALRKAVPDSEPPEAVKQRLRKQSIARCGVEMMKLS
ncbi:hypothetical protein A7A76_15895 [Lysobacter enzymogenes]|uniref:hypothetical protein n=1 Tax=Lysobacter enzymogenes TaxID=69 RepID=UPI0019D01C4C|nr:hypothetical protein [Lysobacter enzymogenes]MBN7136220.1 hypothetical protein [Lysobacter enzymogenes]